MSYHAEIDESISNSSQVIALELVGEDKDVLDIGCAEGDLARALNRRGCRVSGIEMDRDSAALAEADLVRLVIGDVGRLDLVETFGAGSFDAVVLGDVLEHLVDPDAVLRAAVPLLRPGGRIVISVPNVTHGALRLALLGGRWRYTAEGLLDRTHLRFFTRESFLEMVAAAGLRVVDLRGTILDPLNCEVVVAPEELPGYTVEWVRRQPDALVYQFVAAVEVGAQTEPVPELVPAVPMVPMVDDYTDRFPPDIVELGAELDRLHRRSAELERTVLTLRDHAIGAAAAVGEAQLREELARSEVARLEHELRLATHDVTALRGSASWRVGNALVRPVSKLKRVVQGA